MKPLFIILIGIFLLTPAVFADLEITDSALHYGGSGTHKQEILAKSLTIRNTFAGSTLKNFNFDFTERNDFRRSDVEVNGTPTELGPGQSTTILVTVHPHDFDIINTDFEKRGEIEIGSLNLRADRINDTTGTIDGTVTSNAIPLTLEFKNDLTLFKLEIAGSEGSFSTINSGSTATIVIDEDYDLRFTLKNTFESSSGISLDNANIKIESSDFDLDKSTSVSEIAAGEEKEKTTSVSVSDVRTGQVKIYVSADDLWGGKHGEIFTFDFSAEEGDSNPADENDADGDGITDSQDECLNTVSVCDVDATGCPLDSDGDGVCDALDPTPYPTKQQTADNTQNLEKQQKQPIEQETDKTTTPENTPQSSSDTGNFIPFLIGFAVGILVTAGFSALIRS